MQASVEGKPASWRKVMLGEIYDIGSSKRVLQKQWKNSGVPFYRAREIVKLARDGLVANDLFISEAHFAELEKAKGVPQPGDLMVSAVGTLGACYAVKPGDRFYFKDASVLSFRPIVPIDSRFMQYAFLWNGLLDQVKSSDGATVGTFTIARAKATEFQLPQLEEQKRIVAVLDQAFAALDRARAHAKANLADATALLSNWVSATFAVSKGIWREKSLVDVCENLDRLRVPITKSDRESGSIPYYGASGVVDHVAAHIFDEDLLLVSEDGANLLARTYPIAFSIAGKAWVNNHAHVLRFDDLDTQEFVRLYLNSISLEPFVTGMAQPKLNQKALNGIPIPFPEFAEQRRIVAQAREIWEASERAGDRYDRQIADIAQLRQSLLQKAFSGQL